MDDDGFPLTPPARAAAHGLMLDIAADLACSASFGAVLEQPLVASVIALTAALDVPPPAAYAAPGAALRPGGALLRQGVL